MNVERKEKIRLELAKKALPHMMDPDRAGPAGMDVGECAVLLSVSPVKAAMILKSGLSKLGAKLRAMGVRRLDDLFPRLRRGQRAGFSG